MCLIDGSEATIVYTYAERKARKAHVCGECERMIEKGEVYEYYTGLYDFGWTEAKTCLHCLSARRWLEKACNGYVFEQVHYDLIDHWHDCEYYRTPWLARAIFGMQHKWMRRGERMDVLGEPPIKADGSPFPRKGGILGCRMRKFKT